MEFGSYITGFTDGEGCFSISFSYREKLKDKVEVRPSFSISQHKRNLEILKQIHQYFGVGAIRFSNRDQNYKYEVRSITDLMKVIIPHFRRFPLKTVKQKDFEHFEYVCNQIYQSYHLNSDNLVMIIDRAYLMNESGKRRYKKEELLRFMNKMKI